MPDLRLDRAERAPAVVAAATLLEHLTQRLELSPHRRRACPCRAPPPARHCPGRSPPGHRRARAPAPALPAAARRRSWRARRTSSRALDHGVDAVSVPLRIAETPQREHADALSEHRAVSLVGERAAVPRGRQRGRLAEADVHEDVVHRVHPSGDHEVRLPERAARPSAMDSADSCWHTPRPSRNWSRADPGDWRSPRHDVCRARPGNVLSCHST
jgi:hypothetical protein